MWHPAPGRLAIETTDLLIEEVHFSLAHMSWFDVGWKAMAVNVSDVAAMGGQPRAAFVSVGLRREMPASDAEGLYRGLAACAAEYATAILGGDTVASPKAAVVNVALYGESLDEGGAVLRRDQAHPGDAIGVSGPLGASAAYLRLAGSRPAPSRPDDAADLRRMSASSNPAGHLGQAAPEASAASPRPVPATAGEELRSAHVHPRPRVDLGQEVLRAGIRCAMDVSDGLAGDLAKLCQASGVAAEVKAERVPVAQAVRQLLPDDALELALTGGEDYELLVCGPADVLEQLGLTVVGRIIEGSGVTILDASGQPMVFERASYDAFA